MEARYEMDIDVATQVTHRTTPSTNLDSKGGSDFGVPTYMQATKAFSSILNVQRQNSFNLSQGIPVYYRPPPPVNKWQVRKINPNEWKSNNIDSAYGSLYTLKSETCAEPDELPQEISKYRDEEEGEFFTGVDYNHAREKSYIRRATLDMQSPVPGLLERRRFSSHIIQGYNKPKRRPVPGYGAPSSCVLQQPVKNTSDVVDLLVRPPSSYNVMPKRQKPAKCDRPSVVSCEFCDVLGPLSCHECIESTNRRIAHDVEHAAFPDVDCTASSLVAPTLAHLIERSEHVLGKKRRVKHHHRPDTVIEPAFSKAKTALVLPPITNKRTTSNGKLAKALTPRTFGRHVIEREWTNRAQGIRHQLNRQSHVPDIAYKKEGTQHRATANVKALVQA